MLIFIIFLIKQRTIDIQKISFVIIFFKIDAYNIFLFRSDQNI